MFWPDNARIAVTTSLMFEAGSQDLQKTFGPFPIAQEGDFPDLPTNSWFEGELIHDRHVGRTLSSYRA